jgi:hypothetical protein
MLARPLWRASAEYHTAIPVRTIEVSNPASSIDEPAVVGSLGRLGIELFQRIHDVVEANDATVCGLTQIRSRLQSARIRGPRGQDGALFIQSHIRVANDFGRRSERPSWMQQRIDIEAIPGLRAWKPVFLSCSAVIHGHTSEQRRRPECQTRTTLACGYVDFVKRPSNARWCGPCRADRAPCRLQSRCGAASSFPAARARARSAGGHR